MFTLSCKELTLSLGLVLVVFAAGIEVVRKGATFCSVVEGKTTGIEETRAGAISFSVVVTVTEGTAGLLVCALVLLGGGKDWEAPDRGVSSSQSLPDSSSSSSVLRY